MLKNLKDYFIPHEGNDYRPHSLQKIAMVGMVCLVLLSFVATNAQALLWMSSDWLVSTILPAVIVELTNDERSDEALGSLRRNSILDAAATLKAQHMAQNEYFAHFAPDGTSPWYFFGQVQYNFVHAGENLAIHFTDSDEVVDAWMDSPTHRANILNGSYTEIGVGTASGEFDGYKTVYVVQLFGTPAAVPAEPIVAAVTENTELVTDSTETTIAPDTETTTESDTEVLAEAVDITETIEIIPAPPIAVVEDVDIDITTTTPVTTTTTSEIVQNDEDKASSSPVVVYSDFISTTTGGIPASIDTNKDIEKPQYSFIGSLATQPKLVLQSLYILLAMFVLGSLLLSLLIEFRRHQPIQIAYSIALLFLMYGLFTLHTTVSSGALIV